MENNGANKNEVVTIESGNIDNSKLTFDSQVIEKIVAMAVKNIDGVTTVKSGGFSIVNRNSNDGINVEIGETEVAIDLRLILEYGKNAKAIYDKLKTSIEDQVTTMTGLKVVEVNAKVEDVLGVEEFKAKAEE